MKKRNFITHLHLKSKRNYKKRMFQNKVYCMGIAKQYGKEYWMEIENMVMVDINILKIDGKV